MEPSSIHIVEKLLNIGGTAGVLYVAIYYLVRTLKSQYDDRILALEKRSDKCEEDRRALHQEIRQMQVEQMRLIERIARVD
jgi:hypothetical protein